jgi:hypothetical protein
MEATANDFVDQVVPRPSVPDGKSVSGVMVPVPLESIDFAIGVLIVIQNSWSGTAEYYRRSKQTEVTKAKGDAAEEYFLTVTRHIALLRAAKGLHEASRNL